MIALLTALTVKHFIADFLYQPPYQWQNKSKLGHPGGIVHAGQHGLATFVILLFFVSLPLAWLIAAAEMVVHYFIDYAKMNINASKGWKCNTHNEFWVLTGLDQLLHSLTYLAIAAVIF